MHEWPIDSLEGRGNGRLICYDPRTRQTRTVVKNLIFPNGVCLGPDQQSVLFAESWACTIKRYWFDRPKSGQVEVVIPSLPGYPDNIHKASDGKSWVALRGMRGRVFDFAIGAPVFRRSMGNGKEASWERW